MGTPLVCPNAKVDPEIELTVSEFGVKQLRAIDTHIGMVYAAAQERGHILPERRFALKMLTNHNYSEHLYKIQPERY